MASPQSWNRYSYVLNNPINASDPSGHKCVGEPGECLKADGSTGAGFTGGPHSSGAHGGCGNLGQKRCDGKPPRYGDGLMGPPQYPKVDLPPLDLNMLLSPPNLGCAPNTPCLSATPNGALQPLYDPLNPDYQAISISAGEGVGGTGVVTWDRYGNIFLGLGVNAGKSLTVVSGSYVRGWIGDPFDNHYPSARDSEGFLTGLAVNVSAGVLGGGGATFSPGSNTSVLGYETGAYTPQAGGSIIFSGLIYDAK